MTQLNAVLFFLKKKRRKKRERNFKQNVASVLSTASRQFASPYRAKKEMDN